MGPLLCPWPPLGRWILRLGSPLLWQDELLMLSGLEYPQETREIAETTCCSDEMALASECRRWRVTSGTLLSEFPGWVEVIISVMCLMPWDPSLLTCLHMTLATPCSSLPDPS